MGSKKTKTKSTYTPPSWVENNARSAIDVSQRIANQNYTPYEGDRVAGLSENEQLGMRMARETRGAALPYYDEAAGLARRGTQQFKDADMSQYMNPYIKNALDPAAREIREEGARGAMQLDSRASSMDAFGGSRAALMRSENREKTIQGVKDLYGEGMARAYEHGVSIWGEERTRDLYAAGRIQDLGTAVSNANRTDISTLMATGATDRGIQQAMNDFDYSQFIENRDWDFRSLGALISALEGTKGSYSTTTKSTTKESGGELAQAIGLGASLLGTFYNPVGTAMSGLTQMGTNLVDDQGYGGGGLVGPPNVQG
jgi:hypothetical protein